MSKRIGTDGAGLGHSMELESGTRFAFGRNWSRFIGLVDEGRLEMAEESLRQMLGCQDLRGRTFLDIGSGSGLFSLAARRLGARVHSFDYDPQSVACTEELKRRHFPGDTAWTIECGSALDEQYLCSLGAFDVVYSWGVLHHTGKMWQALGNAMERAAPNGLLFIAIYNDQGRTSRVWLAVKRAYNRLPTSLRWLVLVPAMLRLWGPTTVRDLLQGRAFLTWRDYSRQSMRGMSPWRDVVDWVGGLPFEVAKPEEILACCRKRGFELIRLRTCAGGHGCNEYVFARKTEA